MLLFSGPTRQLCQSLEANGLFAHTVSDYLLGVDLRDHGNLAFIDLTNDFAVKILVNIYSVDFGLLILILSLCFIFFW